MMDVLRLYKCSEQVKHPEDKLIEGLEIKDKVDSSGKITEIGKPAIKKEEVDKWEENDIKALIHIRTRCADHIVVAIAEYETSHTAWQALECLYDSKGVSKTEEYSSPPNSKTALT